MAVGDTPAVPAGGSDVRLVPPSSAEMCVIEGKKLLRCCRWSAHSCASRGTRSATVPEHGVEVYGGVAEHESAAVRTERCTPLAGRYWKGQSQPSTNNDKEDEAGAITNSWNDVCRSSKRKHRGTWAGEGGSIAVPGLQRASGVLHAQQRQPRALCACRRQRRLVSCRCLHGWDNTVGWETR